jgi:hypothetical protein
MELNGEEFSVKQFKDQFRGHRLSLAFQGIFSQDVLTLLGQTFKRSPQSEMLSKRLFGIVIEMAQNIHHYSAIKEFSEKEKRDIGIGIIAVGETDDSYLVSSGNYVYVEDADIIRTRSNFINQLTEKELKEYYRQQRKAPQREGKPGANLGFIDMTRKAGKPIGVDLIDSDLGKSFFILTVRIDKQ